MATEVKNPKILLETIVKDVLAVIDREREREIIARRFGLFERKETLEQIGELLGITRERVRQLEKAVITKLKATAIADIPHVQEIEALFTEEIQKIGHIARISELTAVVSETTDKIEQARVSFLAQLVPSLAYVEESDHFYMSAGIAAKHSEKAIRDQVGNVIETIKKIGEPAKIEEISGAMGNNDANHTKALATISKNLAHLNGRWGLTKWPMVNPKNIRDKIYVILRENGKQMHFGEIAKAIRDSGFKRNEVTTQAIHNELIKDNRFVLVGRGIYALKEWGYSKGTVADVITEVLIEAKQPLHRDEIVKRVLKKRFVKETTILLNLQGKAEFKRVAKATYDVVPAK